MFTTSILSACLEGHISFDNMPVRTDEFLNFRILDGDSQELNSLYLHIGRAQDLYDASKKKWLKDQVYTIVITDGDEVMDMYLESPSFHIVLTDKKLNSVINSLSELADEYSRMNSLKRHLTGAVGVADPLIEGAAKAMNADCFYLTGRFRVVSCFKNINCPRLLYLKPGEYLEAKDLSMLRDEWTTYGDWTARLSPIEYEDAVNAYILVIMNRNFREKFNSDMLQLLKSCMTDFIEQTFTDKNVTNGRFTKLASDIIEGRINSQEALTERLRNIYIVPNGHFYLIVLETEKLMTTIPSDIFPTVGAMFPNSFPVQYDNKLLLMVPADDYGNMVNYDEKELLELLREYRLYGCIGNLMTSLRSLKADYLKVSKCLGFARTFCENKNQRFFRAESFAIYDIIDICCNALTGQYHGDTIRLCNRGAVALYNYDKLNKTEYANILKHYLLNDKNTSKTAEEFGMHRNTLMYKLDKISEMTGEDLDDPMISFRLLFSLFTIEYLDIYQNRSSIEPDAFSTILKGKKKKRSRPEQ